jgi:basic amino acid/polyamine antiporter, APA family
VIACLLVLAGNFYQLLSYTVFFMLLTCIATAIGVFVLRVRKPDLARPYKVWGYPFTTLVFVIAYTWIAVRVFLYNPQNALIGIFIVLIGIPFFIYWRNESLRKETEKQFCSGHPVGRSPSVQPPQINNLDEH